MANNTAELPTGLKEAASAPAILAMQGKACSWTIKCPDFSRGNRSRRHDSTYGLSRIQIHTNVSEVDDKLWVKRRASDRIKGGDLLAWPTISILGMYPSSSSSDSSGFPERH